MFSPAPDRLGRGHASTRSKRRDPPGKPHHFLLEKALPIPATLGWQQKIWSLDELWHVSSCIGQNFWSKTSAGLILTLSCDLPWHRNPKFNFDYEQPVAWHPNSTKMQLELSYPWQADHGQRGCKFDLSNLKFLMNPESCNKSLWVSYL